MTNQGPASLKVDLARQQQDNDVSRVEDGPLFRATMKSMEQRTGSMRSRWKKVLKRAQEALEAQKTRNNSEAALMMSFQEASSSNANAVKPAMDHYFNNIAKEILIFEKQKVDNLQRMVIDPIQKLYSVDIKQAETKKRDFDEESKEFYAYVGRYLGQRQDSMKEKKRAETDSKYQSKRRNFELKRFDYSSFMQDLHGGRKDQEVLSHLTRYADAQAKGYLATARRIESMLPQLEALSSEVKDLDKEFQLQRTEREEKRRALEKTSVPYADPDAATAIQGQAAGMPPPTSGRPTSVGDMESLTRSNGSVASPPTMGSISGASGQTVTVQQGATAPVHSPSQKFKGIRDLEEKDYMANLPEATAGTHRKEGLLWALSRPGSHADPKGLNKQAWHKFWIVMDQGKITEYTNWKEKLDLHMDPIDLRVASVREARNAERRFCFEVITPQFTRVYQAPSEEGMRSWISAINNALQSAVEGFKAPSEPLTESLPGATRRDIASVLTGKSTSLSHRGSHGSAPSSKAPSRHATDGKPQHYSQAIANSERLLKQVREADEGNKVCADCGSESKVDWVSLNLGIVLCIDCGGVHRSLGSHISKVRSLTLDTTSFNQDTIEILLTIGNRVSNMIWEAKLEHGPNSPKPTGATPREQRTHFIVQKYQERAFVQSISATLSHYSTADETLLASIKKNDIQNVLYALALRANPNAADRSRHTHPVHLALAAADPASPNPSVPSTPSAGPRKPFTIAELLLLNGADLPSQPPPFPLSPAAQTYLEQKNEQRNGKRLGGDGAGDAPPVSQHAAYPTSKGDGLTALPIMQGSPTPSSAGIPMTGFGERA